MTIIGMHTAVDLGLQRIGSNALENFYSEEIDAYLNDAINKYIKIQVDEIRMAGERHVTAHENLRSLTKWASVALAGHTMVNSYTGSLPSDFHLFVSANTTDANSAAHRTEYVTPTEFLRSLPTLSDTPVFRHMPLTMLESAFVIARDSTLGVALSSAQLVYIKAPDTVVRDDVTPANNVSCNLPAHTHQEIVDFTVALMVEDLYQSGPKRSDPQKGRQKEQ